MKRLLPVVALAIVVVRVSALSSVVADELTPAASGPSLRWLTDEVEQQPGNVIAEEKLRGSDRYSQSREWLLPEGTENLPPHLLYAQWGAGGRRTVRCESDSERYAYCRTYTTGRVRLRERLSEAPCVQYQSWGADNDGSGIWVRNGCRAIFSVSQPDWKSGGWGGGRDTITCKSEHFEYNHCPTSRNARRVKLERQLSDASCIQGSSWGTDRYGVWVDNGCAAEFSVR